MTIVIGYVPTPVGEAALEAGLAEAAAHGDDVVILNSPRRGSTVDADLVGEEAEAADLRRPRAAERAASTASVDHADHGADIVDDVLGRSSSAPARGWSSSACAAARPWASW